MKAAPISLPAALQQRIGAEAQRPWFGVGNTALLNEPLLGLIASRQCPSGILLQTLDRLPQWLAEQRIILSGFHAPLEQQVLRSLLRRKGRAVKLLARGLTDYRIPAAERPTFDAGHLLILTACPPETRRTTRATALARNRLILSLATETLTPHITPGSPLAALVSGHGDNG